MLIIRDPGSLNEASSFLFILQLLLTTITESQQQSQRREHFQINAAFSAHFSSLQLPVPVPVRLQTVR